MLLRILRSFAAHPAEAGELLPVADLPEAADALAVAAVREANALAGRDPGRAAAPLAQLRKRRPNDSLSAALHGFFLDYANDRQRADVAFADARALDASRPVEAGVGHHFFAKGVDYINAKRPQAAGLCLRIAERLLPHSAAPAEMLGLSGYLSGETGEARMHFERALAVATPAERGALEVNRLIDTLPQVGETAAEVARERVRFETELVRLLRERPAISDPLAAVHRTAFFLGYQGRNDRDANARLADLMLATSPALGYVSPALARAPLAGRRPVIGFVSAYLGNHSVGSWYRDFVRLLIENGRFETVFFAYGDIVDAKLKAAAESRGAFVPLGKTLEEARARIEGRAPDALVYTDVALHPFPYFLAFSRLAPLQALLMGHPCTSGIPTLDRFVSNVFQDGEGAQAHYTERLVRLPRIAVHVARTAPPATPLTRAELGWDAGTRYYVCPMLLQKLHPDFDEALGAILRRDPQGEVVLFADADRPLWQERLAARFARVLPDVADRIAFRPHAPKAEFLSVLQAADCLLDPFHFSGGVTSYIAISLGAPLVTLPGELLRSRMTAGMYEQAGVTECIARSPEHYVDLAFEFASDPARRDAYRARLVAAHPKLFETRDAVTDFEDWIERAVREAR
ncbi:MAG: hypothetical protein MUC55_09980 [Burkholderiales bacterium]|jgi:hypothetical protein|nr:hypothetical protein [Burkholderiales bacterium]